MCAYYILQFKPNGPKDGWKTFRRNSRILVYANEEKAKQDSHKYGIESKKQFRFKQILTHPKVKHPKCKWEEV